MRTPRVKQWSYLWAMLLCSITPAAMAFTFTGAMIRNLLLIWNTGYSDLPGKLLQWHAAPIAGILGALSVVIWFGVAAIIRSPDLPETVPPIPPRQVRILFITGVLSAVFGILIFDLSWRFFTH